MEQEFQHHTATTITAPLAPKQRKSALGRVGLGFLAALSIAGGLWMGVTDTGRDFAETMPDAVRTLITLKKDPDLLFDNVRSNRVNILLVGEDYNWTIKPVFNPRTGKFAPFQVLDKDAPPRSDTMIVFTFDRDKRAARMISLPRDARVTYTDLDGDTHHNRKLNAVYASGGKDPQRRQILLKRFLQEEFGLRIDRVAIIKPNSFKKLVNMAGGVYVKVDGALKINPRTGKRERGLIHYKDNWGRWEVKLKPGSQWLNGDQAHGYVRFRKDAEGDPGRIRRQQAVMKALAKRFMEKPFWQIPGVVKEIRREFRTDMSDDELGSAALFARNLGSAEQIQPLTLFGRYASDGDIVLNRPKNKKLLAHLFGDSFNEESFLRESSWTRRDDIGPANNASPGVKTLLKEAGIE